MRKHARAHRTLLLCGRTSTRPRLSDLCLATLTLHIASGMGLGCCHDLKGAVHPVGETSQTRPEHYKALHAKCPEIECKSTNAVLKISSHFFNHLQPGFGSLNPETLYNSLNRHMQQPGLSSRLCLLCSI